jgi:hypothetical protein
MALEPQKNPDIFIIRGDTTSINFTVAGVDLTGATVFFTVKPELTDDSTDTNAVITKEVTSHSDPTAGETVIELDSTDTDVEPGVYYYDIQIKRASGTILSIPARKLKIWADVTRRTT